MEYRKMPISGRTAPSLNQPKTHQVNRSIYLMMLYHSEFDGTLEASLDTIGRYAGSPGPALDRRVVHRAIQAFERDGLLAVEKRGARIRYSLYLAGERTASEQTADSDARVNSGTYVERTDNVRTTGEHAAQLEYGDSIVVEEEDKDVVVVERVFKGNGKGVVEETSVATPPPPSPSKTIGRPQGPVNGKNFPTPPSDALTTQRRHGLWFSNQGTWRDPEPDYSHEALLAHYHAERVHHRFRARVSDPELRHLIETLHRHPEIALTADEIRTVITQWCKAKIVHSARMLVEGTTQRTGTPYYQAALNAAEQEKPRHGTAARNFAESRAQHVDFLRSLPPELASGPGAGERFIAAVEAYEDTVYASQVANQTEPAGGQSPDHAPTQHLPQQAH